MKTYTFTLAISLAFQSLAAFATESTEEMLSDFDPLISKVRGGVRYSIETGKGCLPWASLATDLKEIKSFVDFAFTADMVKKIGDPTTTKIGALLLPAASKGPFKAGAIGTCEFPSSNSGGNSPTVIKLHLERRNGSAITMRFPFEQSEAGQISYIKGKESVENATPLLFIKPSQ